MAGLYDRADFYDPVAGHNSAAEALYTRLAGVPPKRVLDIGCGSGRFALPLARAGHDVTGVDAAPDMLAALRAAAAREGLRVTAVEADFRSFDLGEDGFDFAFSAANTLLHLRADEEFVETLATVRRHLSPGGLLAFDLFVPNREILERNPLERHTITEIEHPSQGTLYVSERTSYDAATQMLSAHWFWEDRAGALVHEATFALRQRFPDELQPLLRQAGFSTIERFGGFSGEPFESTSHHQVYVLSHEAH